MVDARSAGKMTAAGSFAEAWLRERLDLLERFCLPSLVAQTSRNFVWALFCDEVTDRDVLDRLREHSVVLPNLRLAMTAENLQPRAALDELIDADAEVLITTRLDSDDALSDEYLESVQAYAEPFHSSSLDDLLVNFPHGYRLDSRSGELYAEWMPFSPFHSLLERPQTSPVKTVMHGGHGRLHYQHMTQQDESLARWMIVVHGGNLINKIRDGMQRVDLDGAGIPGFTLDYR